MRADARRRIILYYQTQVSLRETGSEPLGLGPSSSVENGLPPWVAQEKIGTLLLASSTPQKCRFPFRGEVLYSDLSMPRVANWHPGRPRVACWDLSRPLLPFKEPPTQSLKQLQTCLAAAATVLPGADKWPHPHRCAPTYIIDVTTEEQQGTGSVGDSVGEGTMIQNLASYSCYSQILDCYMDHGPYRYKCGPRLHYRLLTLCPAAY